MYEVDARGLSCPEPVMMTAEAIKNHGDDTIKVHVSKLRNKLQKVNEFDIVSVKGIGYKAVIGEGV